MSNKKRIIKYLASIAVCATVIFTSVLQSESIGSVTADANPFPSLAYLNVKQNKNSYEDLPIMGVNENYNENITGIFNKDSMGKGGKEKIKEWKEYNDDVVAWIKIPGTNINYPIVQRETNVFYRQRGYDKNYDVHGVIYQDYDSDGGSRANLSRNTILYGHNWDNIFLPQIGDPRDIAFAQLMSYHYKDFASQYPYIYYSTPDEDMVWAVFATFYTDTDFYYISSNPSQNKLSSIIETAKKRSRHNFDIEVTDEDKIITLSTCTRVYGPRADQRFVVMAKLLTEEEAKDLKAINVTGNTNYESPQFKNPLPGYPIA